VLSSKFSFFVSKINQQRTRARIMQQEIFASDYGSRNTAWRSRVTAINAQAARCHWRPLFSSCGWNWKEPGINSTSNQKAAETLSGLASTSRSTISHQQKRTLDELRWRWFHDGGFRFDKSKRRDMYSEYFLRRKPDAVALETHVLSQLRTVHWRGKTKSSLNLDFHVRSIKTKA